MRYQVIVFVFIFSAVNAQPSNRVRRQGQTFNLGQRVPGRTTINPIDVVSSTTAAAPAPTTASPQYIACLAACPSIQSYNPICGTDGETYNNQYRLDCAVSCGREVRFDRRGTCGTPNILRI